MKNMLVELDDFKGKLRINYYILITMLVGFFVLLLSFWMMSSSMPMWIYFLLGVSSFIMICRQYYLQAKINDLFYEIAAYYILKT